MKTIEGEDLFEGVYPNLEVAGQELKVLVNRKIKSSYEHPLFDSLFFFIEVKARPPLNF
jgi:hypothetical protein